LDSLNKVGFTKQSWIHQKVEFTKKQNSHPGSFSATLTKVHSFGMQEMNTFECSEKVIRTEDQIKNQGLFFESAAQQHFQKTSPGF